jgi:transcriptional regulator with XRE-family HTH domain
MAIEEINELKETGKKIRSLRKSRKFTLQDIGDAAGCTKAYVSQIENGVASPSISVLKRIATALEIKLVDLFITPGTEEDDVVTKRGEGCKIKYPRGDASLALLVKNLDGRNMEPLLKRLDPKTGSDGLYAHQGSQEFGYVISGSFDLLIDDKVYTLGEGDSFYFDSSRPHGFVNNGNVPAEIVWVISPPTY